jgi:hypothetical protein
MKEVTAVYIHKYSNNISSAQIEEEEDCIIASLSPFYVTIIRSTDDMHLTSRSQQTELKGAMSQK